jgi:hypothetical protein
LKEVGQVFENPLWHILLPLSMAHVTPCFPQFVKITKLVKNCGKLMNVICDVNMYGKGMNMNNIMNLYYKTIERGCAEKDTTMAVEGTWKGGVNFHRESIPYLDSTGSENQKWLAGPELNVSQAGR